MIKNLLTSLFREDVSDEIAMTNKMKIKCSYEIVKVIEIEPIELATKDDEPVSLRAEVLKSRKNRYTLKVYRHENYRLTPTYPLDEKKMPLFPACDKSIFVSENAYDWSEINEDSEEKVVEKFIEIIEAIFCVKIV